MFIFIDSICNMKLSISDQFPIILFDTEGNGEYWLKISQQIQDMVKYKRAPDWIIKNIFVSGDPKEIIEFYKSNLQLF